MLYKPSGEQFSVCYRKPTNLSTHTHTHKHTHTRIQAHTNTHTHLSYPNGLNWSISVCEVANSRRCTVTPPLAVAVFLSGWGSLAAPIHCGADPTLSIQYSVQQKGIRNVNVNLNQFWISLDTTETDDNSNDDPNKLFVNYNVTGSKYDRLDECLIPSVQLINCPITEFFFFVTNVSVAQSLQNRQLIILKSATSLNW